MRFSYYFFKFFSYEKLHNPIYKAFIKSIVKSYRIKSSQYKVFRCKKMTPIFYFPNMYYSYNYEYSNNGFTLLFMQEMIRRKENRKDDAGIYNLQTIERYYWEKHIHNYHTQLRIMLKFIEIKNKIKKFFNIPLVNIDMKGKIPPQVKRMMKSERNKEERIQFYKLLIQRADEIGLYSKDRKIIEEEIANSENTKYTYEINIEKMKEIYRQSVLKGNELQLSLKEKIQNYFLNFVKLYHESLQNLIEGQREVLKDKEFVMDDNETVQNKLDRFEEFLKAKMPKFDKEKLNIFKKNENNKKE